LDVLTLRDEGMEKLREDSAQGILLSFGAESFVFQYVTKNIKIKISRTQILPLFCMGVKLGLSH
jgi:hypothetical protein